MKQGAKKNKVRLSKRLELATQQAGSGSKEHIKENFINRLQHAKQVRLLILEWILLVVVITSLALTQAFWYQQSYSTTSFISGGVYTEATLGKVNSLNPIFATTNSEKVLSRLMFATISQIDYSGHVGLGLAESIVPDDTGKIWTVKLKKNLKWSDGEPITAEDVTFTIKMLKSPVINSSYSSNFSGVEVSTEGDSAIIFTLPAVYADFNAALNVPVLPEHILGEVAPANLLENAFSNNPVTSGPFAFNASQSITANDRIIYLSRNAGYFATAPMLDSFAIRTFENTEDITSALASGEVTATAELPPNDTSANSMDNIYEKQTAISSGVFAFFNTTSPVLADTSVRKAIQQGINSKEMLNNLNGELPLKYPILESQIKLNEYPEIPAYDLEAAKAKVAKLEQKELNLVTINSGYLPEIAQNMSSQLEKIGFKVTLTTYDPGQEFLINVIRPRNYDILIYEVELGADPDLFAYYHSSQASSSGLNLSNYHNSMADDAILAARSTMDENLRVAKYETFLRYWVEDVPAIGIYQASLTYHFNKNIRTFSEDDRLVYATDRFSDVEYWAVNKTEKNRTP